MQHKSFFRNFIVITLTLWAIFSLLLYQNLALLGMVVIAFLLGLRHGFDVDHIIAIDNTTRQLAEKGNSSATTGLFFALGHSSVVFLLTLVVILGMSLAQTQKAGLLTVGAIIGSIVSILFLWLTGSMNTVSLYRLIKYNHTSHAHSPFTRWLKPVFKLIDKPYKMYFVGFFFGLGFDTATEIALLGLAATATLNGESPWAILCLPAAFALGMTWVDSLDALIMTKLVDKKLLNSAKHRTFNITILLIVIVTAFSIGFIQLCGLVRFNMRGVVNFIANHSPWFGGMLFFVLLILLFLFKFTGIFQRKNIPLQ
jgi:high-affinity nickel-transport protein